MPCAANSSPRDAERLASLTFFLDYQIGRYIVADALRAAGAHVEVHVDHFAQNAPDVEWLPEVGRHGWVLITKDEHIHRNLLEREAYKTASLRGFVVTGKDMAGGDLAALLVTHLSGMVRRVAGRRGPLLYTLTRGGTFSKIF